MDSWDYQESLDLIDYMPQKNSFFDLWQYEGTTKPEIEEGHLGSEHLNDYLSRQAQLSDPDRQLVGGLRIIYSCIDPQLDCSDKTIFWARSDFIKIMDSFRLPRRFTQMMARCHCTFAKCSTKDIESEEERFSYIFSTMFHHSPFWIIAVSWDSTTNITYAFLHCTSDPEEHSIARLKRFLVESVPHSLHPLLLPLLIMDLETNLTLRDDEEYTRDINTIEDETRQAPDTSATPVNTADLHILLTIQRLNGCSIFLSLIERESEAVLLHLDQLRSMTSEIQFSNSKLTASSKRLLMHAEFLTNSRKNLLLRLQNLQRRSQTQLDYAYNLLTRKYIELYRGSEVLSPASTRNKILAISTTALSGTLAIMLVLLRYAHFWQRK